MSEKRYINLTIAVNPTSGESGSAVKDSMPPGVVNRTPWRDESGTGQ